MDSSFSSAVLYLRICPTDTASSVQNDLCTQLFTLAFVVTAQQTGAPPMSVSRKEKLSVHLQEFLTSITADCNCQLLCPTGKFYSLKIQIFSKISPKSLLNQTAVPA